MHGRDESIMQSICRKGATWKTQMDNKLVAKGIGRDNVEWIQLAHCKAQ